MTSQQLEKTSEDLEKRVEILENELAQIKQLLSEANNPSEPWWLKITGSFENDPTFDEATFHEVDPLR